MPLEDILSARDSEKRDHRVTSWHDCRQSSEDRLIKFDRWVLDLLRKRLQWPADQARAAKQQCQCRVELERLVIDLWRRGWMLDGKRLASHIEAAVDDVAKAQAAGRVTDFFPFFRSVMGRYVGLNAEEIRSECMAAGTHVGQIMANLLKHTAAPMPELLAKRREEIAEVRQETLRAKIARRRAEEARREAEKSQLHLL